MAKYQFTELYSGINFNSVDTSLMGVGKKVGNDDNRGADTETLTEIATDNGGKLPTIVNAVEIDWNGAQWPTSEPETPEIINTTGDLINAIKWASTQGPNTELPTWTEASGGPDDDNTLEAGGSFVVPHVKQEDSGQVTVENKTFTLPQHKTITNDQEGIEFNSSNGIITGIKYDRYGHINDIISKEIITIHWDDNGATSSHTGVSFVIKDNNVELPTEPHRGHSILWAMNDGSNSYWNHGGTQLISYTFKGWYDDTSSRGIRIDNNTIPSTNTTYYAQWTAPTNITLPTTNPTRTGYTFKGWATTSTATIPDVTENSVPSSNEPDIIYYAVWAPTIQYWYQGATNPTILNSAESSWTQVSGDQTSIKFGVQDPELNDYEWYFAVPTRWNFTKMSDVLGTTDLPTESYEVTTKTISGIDYTVFHWLDETDAMYGTIQ